MEQSNKVRAIDTDVRSDTWAPMPTEPDLSERCRIFIIGHQDFVADGLCQIFHQAAPEFRVTCVDPGQACRSKIQRVQPEVLLMHVSVVPRDPAPFFADFVAENPRVRFLVFGHGMDDEFLFRLIRAGAHGYLNEHMGSKHLMQAVRAVRAGELWMERRIASRFVDAARSSLEVRLEDAHTRAQALIVDLSKREAQILAYTLRGLEIKDIAEAIFLSQQGVKTYLSRLFQRFSVKNRTQLIVTVLNRINPCGDISGLFAETLSVGRG